jgi:inward rectifier potassium channel
MFFGLIAGGFVLINMLFGTAFWLTGGVVNAHNFADSFFFSIHTFGTIGYGSMYPGTYLSESVMAVEALTSLAVNALITGLAFAKFARPTARLLWSEVAVISDRDGVPTLMVRVANERINHIVDATVKMAVLRQETTLEGESVRKVVDMALVRTTSPTFLLTWSVMHQITKDSPLYGRTADELKAVSAEIVLTMTGLDETLSQIIHDRHSYIVSELRYETRFADVLGRSTDDGRRILDLGQFHSTVPAKLTWAKMGVST